MLRNNNNFLTASPVFKLFLGLSLCTLGGALLFVYFRDNDEENRQIEDKRKDQKKSKNNGKAKTSPPHPEITQHLVISNEHIPLIVGRTGSNLSLIEEKTATTIQFKDKDENHKICEIRGFSNGVAEAKLLLLKEIDRSPIVKEEISVPQSVCGKIIGRCGESMQEICRLSLAKVSIDSGGRSGGNGGNRRKITITGNRTQVNIARKLIEDKIQEDEDIRRTVAEIEQNREPRRSPTNSISSSKYSSQTSLHTTHLPAKEKLPLPTGAASDDDDDKPMDVYVSAIASPSKFWVQIIGGQSKQLDELVRTMTEYYELEENRRLHQIIEPYLGQIVAVIFKYDDKWYRAEIVGILPNQYNPKDVVLDLYFVDYGDSEYVAPHEVFELRTDFLTLRFQAIECFLANIKSNDSNDPDSWDQQAIQAFEDFTQVAAWKKLALKVVTYKDRPKSTAAVQLAGNRSVRETSPIPGVELLDVNEDGTELNMADILLSQGLAVAENQTTTTDSGEILRLGGGNSTQKQSPDAATAAAQTTAKEAQIRSVEDQLLHEQKRYQQNRNNNNSLRENDTFALATPSPAPAAATTTRNGNISPPHSADTASQTLPTPGKHFNLNGNLVS